MAGNVNDELLAETERVLLETIKTAADGQRNGTVIKVLAEAYALVASNAQTAEEQGVRLS